VKRTGHPCRTAAATLVQLVEIQLDERVLSACPLSACDTEGVPLLLLEASAALADERLPVARPAQISSRREALVSPSGRSGRGCAEPPFVCRLLSEEDR
jgi:hypothetical protein